MAKVRLTRKFAQIINGIDLSRVRAGEELELSDHDARLLIAEGWAAPIESADDKPPRQKRRSDKNPSTD
jgi:hypothetical protein